MSLAFGVLRRTSFLAPLCALTMLALGTAEADAALFCVHADPCAGGVQKTTIQGALDDAAVNNLTDTILVGANGGVPYVETLSYTDSETVQIVGDGVGETIIEGPTSFSVAVTLLSPNSTIRHLTIRAPDVENGTALRWNGSASDIEAVHLGSAGTIINGMIAETGALLDQSKVDVNGFGLFKATNATGVTIRNSTLNSDGSGIAATNAGLTLERSTVTGKRSTVTAGGTSTVNVFNAVLRMTGTMFGDGAITALSGADVQVRHTTVVGAGGAAALFASANTGNTTVTIFDSIFDNFEHAFRCFGESGKETTFGVAYSNWVDTVQENAGCNKTNGAGNLAVEPAFVSTLFRDYRLKAPSPLIDAADPASPFKLDRLSLPRPIDGDGKNGGRADIGAFEYQRQPPKAAIKAPATAAIGSPAAFSASGSSDPDPGDVLAYSWDFGDGGAGSGFSAQHTYAAGGDYTVTLTATDPTGLKATATAQVQVPAPPGGGAAGGEAPPDPGADTPAGTAVTLFGVRAVPKRVKRGKGRLSLLPGARQGIRFVLSAAARVRLTLQHCRGRQGCAKRSAVPGSASFSAPAGPSTISFKGRLKGKSLPAGRYRATLKVAGQAVATALVLP